MWNVHLLNFLVLSIVVTPYILWLTVPLYQLERIRPILPHKVQIQDFYKLRSNENQKTVCTGSYTNLKYFFQLVKNILLIEWKVERFESKRCVPINLGPPWEALILSGLHSHFYKQHAISNVGYKCSKIKQFPSNPVGEKNFCVFFIIIYWGMKNQNSTRTLQKNELQRRQKYVLWLLNILVTPEVRISSPRQIAIFKQFLSNFLPKILILLSIFAYGQFLCAHI